MSTTRKRKAASFISKKIRAQDQALLLSPEFYITFLERVGQSGVIVVNDLEQIIYVSQRAARLLGRTVAGLVGKNYFQEIVFTNDRAERLLEKKQPVWSALHVPSFNQVTPFFCFYQRKKQRLPMAMKVSPVPWKQSVGAAILQIREVKRILKVDEMKSLFVSFAAHQLKTPSSIVKGFLELLIREGKKGYQKRQWDNIQSAYEANENLIRLSRTLLNLTKLEGGLIEPKIGDVNVRDVLQQKIASHRLLLEIKQLKITFNFKGKQTNFETDVGFFSEVFEILFNNAVKYSPKHGHLSVTCQLTPQAVKVAVSDEGPGITSKEQKQLFHKISSTDPDQNSHGLGLMMAKKYLALVGGTIGVKSNGHKGTTFFFMIPKPLY